jgi:hypothetical protein
MGLVTRHYFACVPQRLDGIAQFGGVRVQLGGNCGFDFALLSFSWEDQTG